MTTKRCATCGVEIDTESIQDKKCSECGAWFCGKHVGQYKFQCVLCKAYALSNKHNNPDGDFS